jgi:uncharacterized protein YfkK (UPF0435 family)
MINFIPRLVLLFVTIITCTALLPSVSAKNSTEYKVKAAFIYNFLKFTTWPESAASGSINICVMGDNPFGETLLPLEKKKIKGRAIRVTNISNTSKINNCTVAFVSDSEEDRLDDIIKSVQKKPILTVSDISHFAQEGGVIGFYERDGKIKFAINTANASKSGLVLSAKLLELSKVIE